MEGRRGFEGRRIQREEEEYGWVLFSPKLETLYESQIIPIHQYTSCQRSSGLMTQTGRGF